MNNMKKNLYINQIFRGIAPSQYFGVDGTYNSASAIDPDLPISSSDIKTSGFPVPVGSTQFGTPTTEPINLVTNPKDNLLYILSSYGITYYSSSSLTSLSSFTTPQGSTWLEYYNNYIYAFGNGTNNGDIARIGPLNTLPYDGQTGNFTAGLTVTGGTSGATAIIVSDVDAGTTGTLTLSNIKGFFVDNETITDTSTGSATVNRTVASLVNTAVWTGATLGSQTALKNTIYPSLNGIPLSNHVAYVHSDGSMYFCDFKDGQGLIHRINTKKVTNEGDTNGTTVPSAYNVLDLPFGFYPTCMTGYNTDIIIGGIYSTDTSTNQANAAFVIWDPTDTSSFKIGPIPLADPLVTAMKNVNGTVYIWTGNAQNGVRVSIYNGGISVREIVYQEEGLPPRASAVDALGSRIVWGTNGTYPSTGAYVNAYGSKRADLPAGLHCISTPTKPSDSTSVDSYSSGNYSGYSNLIMSKSDKIGQSFTAIAGRLSSASFYLRNNGGTATGSVVAKLYAHSGTYGTSSVPTGTALATSTAIDVATISSTFGSVTFTFDSTYTLVNTTKYVIAIEVDTVGSGQVHVGLDSTSPTHSGNRITYSTTTTNWTADSTTDAIFSVYADTAGASTYITSLKYVQQDSNITPKLVTGWGSASGTGLDKYSSSAALNSRIRWMFNIGSKFDITRIYLPLAGEVESGVIITPTLYFDDLSSNKTLKVINNTNYSGKRKVTYRGAELKNATGYNNFVLEIAYSGTVPVPVALPIRIEIDIKDDET